ncbi:MAG: hypothetical protein Tsb0034_16850 [Ekhidna sp.]
MSAVKKFVLAATIGIVVVSCNVGDLDFDNIEVEPISGVFAVPLGDIQYTMRELVDELDDDDLDLQENDTSLLSLFYSETISYNAEDEFVEIGDITGDGTLDLSPAAGTNGPATATLNQQFIKAYDPQDGEELDSIFYETGDLSLTVNSGLAAGVQLTYTITFLNTRRIGNPETPVSFTGTITGAGTNNHNQNLGTPAHVTRLTDPSGSNDFTIDFDASIDIPAAGTLAGNEDISFDFTYGNQTFSLIYGKLGQDTVQVGDQTIDIDFFKDSGDDGIFFGNPIMRFIFTNTFGIPVGLNLEDVYGDKGNGTNRTFIDGRINERPLEEIAGAETPGDVAETTIEVDKTNSNIVTILSKSPTRLVFDVKGVSNANDATQSNFVRPGDAIEGVIEMEIPLEIRLEDYQQEVDIDLGDGLDTEDVDSAFLRVVTINTLPFSGTLSLEIQDQDSVKIWPVDEEIEELVFKAPFINVNGFVTDPNGTATDIPLGPEGVEALRVGSRLVFNISLNTPTSQTSRDIFVKVLADYMLDIKVGVGGLVNIDI